MFLLKQFTRVALFNAYILLANIVSLQNGVWSLGEDGNFTEFLQMVEEQISEAENYTFPKDNSKLLEVNSNEVKEYGTYDFIVIGAGPAGAVVANRLSEISEWKILLLEAGGQDNDFTKILGLTSYNLQSDLSWGYSTTVQKNACQGMVNKRCSTTTAKVIGGGSTINGALYSRGHPEDFNRWVNTFDNPGWTYEEVLPYFKKSENAKFSPRDQETHGTEGYFTVSQTDETPGLIPFLSNAFGEIGINVTDYNGPNTNGISKPQFALKGNERVSTATSFLNKFTNRSNLHVSLNSFVTKLLIKNNTAYGVKFVKRGQTYNARARNEVIVSAGAINSAQILMLSGVGPENHLKELGIPPRNDLPVGKYLQDHVVFLGFYLRTRNQLYNLTLEEQLKLYLHHKRPLSAGFGVDMVAFTNFPRDHSRRPTVEFLFSTPALSGDKSQLAFALNDKYGSAIKANPATDIWVIIILLHPRSRGRVTLKSKDPRDKPIIDPNYLAEEEDIEMLYEGIKFLVELNNTKAFKEYGAEILVLDYPDCEILEKLTKDWWICALKHLSSSAYHFISTSRMGPDAKSSVVNAKLQVHGMEKLRIADGSIMPEMNSGHQMAPIMMIGEKVADLIKEEYGKLNS